MASVSLLWLLLLGWLTIGLAATDPEDSENSTGGDLSKEDIASFLGTVRLFRNLSDDQIDKIADIAKVRFYPAGAHIDGGKERWLGNSIFVVYGGGVHVIQTSIGRTLKMGKLRHGDYLINTTLRSSGTRMALVAYTDVRALLLDNLALRQIAGDQFVLHQTAEGE